jgi:hypothetical protein
VPGVCNRSCPTMQGNIPWRKSAKSSFPVDRRLQKRWTFHRMRCNFGLPPSVRNVRMEAQIFWVANTQPTVSTRCLATRASTSQASVHRTLQEQQLYPHHNQPVQELHLPDLPLSGSLGDSLPSVPARASTSQASVHRTLQEQQLYPHHNQPVQEFVPHDAPTRRAFCELVLLQSAEDSAFTANVSFMDESYFTRTLVISILKEGAVTRKSSCDSIWSPTPVFYQFIISNFRCLTHRHSHFTHTRHFLRKQLTGSHDLISLDCSFGENIPGRSEWPRGLRQPLEHWGRGFEFHLRHGCLCAFILFVLFCV